MKAHMTNDTCYSTLNGGRNPFNFDGVARDKLDIETARAALDFEIQKRPSYGYNPTTDQYIQIPNQFNLVRDTDNAFIPSKGVGVQFEPVQHRDIFDYVVKDVMPKYPQMELETCGTLYGGGTGLMTFKVGDLFHINGDKSPSEMRLFISNPCNGDGSLIMGFTTVRLFCRNQISAAKQTAKADGYNIRHTRSAKELVGSAIEQIGIQIEAAHQLKERCQRLAELAFNTAEMEECLNRIYPFGQLEEGSVGYTRMKNMRDAVLEQFEGKTASEMYSKTAWTAFNSFTVPIFNPERMSIRTDAADIDYKGMAGDRTERVRRILATVESVAA